MGTGRNPLVVSVVVFSAIGLIGCTDVSRSGSDAPGVRLPGPSAPDQAPAERRSIARSSAKDLAAVLRANGVDDPEHWADVVIAHQPYPAGEPGLSRLRTVLDQDRADPATADKITAVLQP